MAESNMGAGWRLSGREQVHNIQRQAIAVLRTIELLDLLHADALGYDSCDIAECIAEIAAALGFRHAGLVGYMLNIPYDFEDAELEVTAQGLAAGGAARLVVDLPDGREWLGSMDFDELSALVNRAQVLRAVPLAA